MKVYDQSHKYVGATHVLLDRRSCFQRENESESKWSIFIQYFPRNFHYYYGYSFYFYDKGNKMYCVYHLLIILLKNKETLICRSR